MTTHWFSWIPHQKLTALSFWSPAFLLACTPLVILCLLSLSRHWAQFTDPPIIFALIYGMPFVLLTFQDSLGDSVQMTDGINARYYMSEPAASWIHYWIFRLLHAPLNMGAKSAIALSSRVAGVAYSFLVAKISLKLFPDLSPSRRLIHRLIFWTAGVALLFYGYVENTPLALPGELFWVLATLVLLESPSYGNVLKAAAALALATALHGRVGFLLPAFLLACLIPDGSLGTRFKRVFAGGSVYAVLLGLMVAYILLIDPGGISGGPWGNVLGGGNNRMFVPLKTILYRDHWQPLAESMLVAGGLLVPWSVVAILAGFRWRRDDVYLWSLGYLACDLFYLLFWEFDYGPFIDWDLIFSGVGPFLLLASFAVTRSKAPLVVLLPLFLGSVYVDNAFATLVAGEPLALNVVPRGGGRMAGLSCTGNGLRRVYFADSTLKMAISGPEADIPYHEYGPTGVPLPAQGKPLGGVFDGYINIPTAGRYRFFILGQGNIRLTIADRVLLDRWIGYEWRITSEREIRFGEAGWYPIRLEFFSRATPGFPVQLELESAGQTRRRIATGDLCHE